MEYALTIFEVKERIGADGGILEELDHRSLELIVKRIKSIGYEVVAVSLIHSYINPDHELKIKN